MEQITFTRPDDWHLHVRTGAMLKTVIPHTARQFSRAIIMPNLTPPVITVEHAEQYRQEIIQAIPENLNFQPLMTLYLTDSMTVSEIKKAAESPIIFACKLYPAGATTNSDSGVSKLSNIYSILELMQEYNIPLLIHGEVTSPECDIFDRERVFIDTILTKITTDFPELRIVLEHITTEEAVQFVQTASEKIAATITPQHLVFNRNAILVGGVRPHHYCLPIIKREKHRQALITAATSGHPKFFLGTDSAPHFQSKKENYCGCAGCYSAHAAIELYAEVFDDSNKLDNLETFASFNGPDFYGLPRNTEKITLRRNNWIAPEYYSVNSDRLIPLKAGETITWQLFE
jgi:dihydroorotase